MQPVEVPDYSGFFELALIVIGVASFIVTLTHTKADNKVMRILNYLSITFAKKKNTRYIPGAHLNRMELLELEKGVLNNIPTPPVHPKPDRRAAVAHTKAKDV